MYVYPQLKKKFSVLFLNLELCIGRKKTNDEIYIIPKSKTEFDRHPY